MMWVVLAIIVALALAFAAWMYAHQRKLKTRAYLMQEAVRNRDFSFRLSPRGLLFGERAMQETLNNIGQELRRQIAAQEVESWRKLTRVLTHEIMNATTPIASITQAFLGREDVRSTPLEDGIKAIHDTSIGLSSFVENYRKLTALQQPQPTEVSLLQLSESVKALYPQMEWQIAVPADVVITTDEGLLRQVLVNIAKNAQEAGATRIALELTERVAAKTRSIEQTKMQLTISNNGSPISTEIRKDIFTPFFTTKRTGSGIGLPLSRQIVMMLGGDLMLADTPIAGYHTTFVVEFF